jgi:hypothetical protein
LAHLLDSLCFFEECSPFLFEIVHIPDIVRGDWICQSSVDDLIQRGREVFRVLVLGDGGLWRPGSAVDLRKLFRGRIGGWWRVTLLFAGVSVMDCLRWRITGCLPNIISFVGYEHLLGCCFLLFECLLC